MEQIAVSFTNAGAPATGLTPTVNIWEKNGTVRITNGVCQEIAGGWYIYNFDLYSNEKVYLYRFDGGSGLADSDRYKFGGNEMDAYSNKYSWGRTAIPTANYMPNFQKLEKKFKELPNQMPKYDDTELRNLISSLRTIIDSKTNADVTTMIDTLQSDIRKLSEELRSIDVTQNVEQLSSSIDGLNQSLEDVKNKLEEDMLEVHGSIAEKIDGFDQKIHNNLDTRYTAETLAQPVKNLDQKIEELFLSIMAKEMPERLLEKFNVSIQPKKADMSAEEEQAALAELEAMALED